MTMRLGRRLRRARRGDGSHSWGVHAVVILGIGVSLGLVAVSALLNFRMGYRSADGHFDGMVYGLGAGLGDGLKAISPFMMFWGLKRRDWLAVGAAAAVFAVFTTYSFIAALGFAAEHRATKASVARGGIESHGDVRRDKDRAEGRLAVLGLQRSVKEIEQAILTLYSRPVWKGGRTVGDVSRNCTISRPSTREACVEAAELNEEKARAEESATLTDKVATLRGELAKQGSAGVATSEDPQAEALKRITDLLSGSAGVEDIGLGLAVLLALFVELGSGLGLYVATTPWRSGAGEGIARQGWRTTEPAGSDKPMSDKSKRKLGEVESYVLDRLEPHEDGEVPLPDVFDDYVVWCRWRGYVPYARKEFARQFGAVARLVGMPTQLRNRVEIYRQVRLIGR